jgi:hypothetical protein
MLMYFLNFTAYQPVLESVRSPQNLTQLFIFPLISILERFQVYFRGKLRCLWIFDI